MSFGKKVRGHNLFKLTITLVTATIVAANGVVAEPREKPRTKPNSEQEPKLWLRYAGKEGKPAAGKRVVLIVGEQEYRSEESLPMLARLLSERHGFACTVLFSINPKTGFYDPSVLNNIPGLHNLKDADLLILSVRFLNPEGEQQQMLTEYLRSGRPVIGIRTTTHGFRGAMQSFAGPLFGKSGGHHARHGYQGTRGVLNENERKHPVLTGVKDVFGPVDVYIAPSDMLDKLKATPLVYGQVLESLDPASAAVRGTKDKNGNVHNDPMMPVVWTHEHAWPGGVKTRILTSTMGSSQCFVHEGLRRIIVNACYWTTGLEGKIDGELDCDLVGQYKPTLFKGHTTTKYWTERALTPEKLR